MTKKNIQIIVSRATEFRKKEVAILCDNEDIDRQVKDSYSKYPHLFVLCCLMDKQIDANRAWEIPFKVCDAFGTRDIIQLNDIPEWEYQQFFNDNKLHRFNDSMAHVFKSALERINHCYGGNASAIWEGNPSSAAVVSRFLEFEGCGIKIATMATNLLHRAFGVHYSDYSSVDISPDVHIMRVMNRLGIIPDEKKDDRTLAIYKAREINPQYPGVIDGLFWNVGRNHCHPSNPSCQECVFTEVCGFARGRLHVQEDHNRKAL